MVEGRVLIRQVVSELMAHFAGSASVEEGNHFCYYLSYSPFIKWRARYVTNAVER